MGSSSRSNTQCEFPSSSLDQAADGDQSSSICDSISCACASLMSMRWSKRGKQKLLYSSARNSTGATEHLLDGNRPRRSTLRDSLTEQMLGT